MSSLTCTLPICGMNFTNSLDLLKHIKNHLRSNYEVKCPYLNCDKKYMVLSSFSSHVTRCHSSASLTIQPVTMSQQVIELSDNVMAEVSSENLGVSQKNLEFSNVSQQNQSSMVTLRTIKNQYAALYR